MEKAILLERQCPAVEARTHGESLSTRGCALGSLNTPVLGSKENMVFILLNKYERYCHYRSEWELSRSICQKQGKGMNEVPTSVYYVRDIRNSGWPTGRESYGHAVLVVVVGVTSHQGDGNAVHRAMQDR